MALRHVNDRDSPMFCESSLFIYLLTSFLVFNYLTHISLESFLRDRCKRNSPRWDAAKRGVPSGAILFADTIFIEI